MKVSNSKMLFLGVFGFPWRLNTAFEFHKLFCYLAIPLIGILRTGSSFLKLQRHFDHEYTLDVSKAYEWSDFLF